MSRKTRNEKSKEAKIKRDATSDRNFWVFAMFGKCFVKCKRSTRTKIEVLYERNFEEHGDHACERKLD